MPNWLGNVSTPGFPDYRRRFQMRDLQRRLIGGRQLSDVQQSYINITHTRQYASLPVVETTCHPSVVLVGHFILVIVFI